jgi:hypothetical protein
LCLFETNNCQCNVHDVTCLALILKHLPNTISHACWKTFSEIIIQIFLTALNQFYIPELESCVHIYQIQSLQVSWEHFIIFSI